MSPESQRRVARQLAQEPVEREDRTKHSEGIVFSVLKLLTVGLLGAAFYELLVSVGGSRWLSRSLTGVLVALIVFGVHWHSRRNSTL